MAKHDYREFYEKDYLGSWNIPESGELTLTIVKCFQGELNNPGTKKKTKKPVLHFQETEKGMALNVTNGKTIATLYGNYVEAWPGKCITLFKSMTRNPGGGDDVECLRIRPTIPKAHTKAAPPDQPPAATPEAAHSRPQDQDGAAPTPDEALLIKAEEFASCGTERYKAWWLSITEQQRKAIGEARHGTFKKIAAEQA